MSTIDQPAEHEAASRGWALLALMAGSGCAALIYEIVWFQMLELVIGSSAISLGVLLGTFMGGMCLGSLLLPRLIPEGRNPLRVLGVVEAGVGLCGLVMLVLLPFLARGYVSIAGPGLGGVVLRGLLGAACLLPPTLLMGATLPAVSRWTRPTARGVAWLGWFYAANLAGAVLGSLAAGFYLLRVHDMAVATYVAVGLNAIVALAAFTLADAKPSPANPELSAPIASEPEPVPAQIQGSGPAPLPGRACVYGAIGLSGLCALSAEVVWTRLLSLMLGGTVYTFSIILAVFLVGLGLGGALGSLVGRASGRPRLALGCCQGLLTGAIALTAHLLARSLPYWPINPSLSTNPWFNFQLDLLRCAWAILPATVLWGASFPLALAAASSPSQDPGRWVGKVYAANTLGAIIGALVCSLLLIPWLGTRQTQRVLIGLSALAGLMMLLPMPSRVAVKRRWSELWATVRRLPRSPLDWWSIRSAPGPGRGTVESSTNSDECAGARNVVSCRARGRARSDSVYPSNHSMGAFQVGAALVLIGAVVLLARGLPATPWGLIAHGRYLPTKTTLGECLYVGEGLNASVAVTQLTNGVRNFHISGKVEASTDSQDMRLQRMLGHLPALLHPDPRAVLVVGCGAGVTAGSFTVHPGVERIVLCELEPLIPKIVAQYFAAENYNVVRDPRVHVVYDDARHYVLTSREKFDIITSDPIHPWVKGAATLYTREYFQVCRRHLKPGGLVTQWVPLYESNEAAVKSELATFFEVFPNGTVWGNDEAGEGYDLVLLGSAEPMTIDAGRVQRRLTQSDHQRVADSLRNVGFKSALSLLTTYAGRAEELRPWLRKAQINTDLNLRLQYLAGLGLNLYQPDDIYSDLLSYRKFPSALFVGNDEWAQALRRGLGGGADGK